MSLSELIVIFLVALIVFGPSKLPELGYNLGKLIAKARQLKAQLEHLLQQHQQQLALEENIKKAEQAAQHYENQSTSIDN